MKQTNPKTSFQSYEEFLTLSFALSFLVIMIIIKLPRIGT